MSTTNFKRPRTDLPHDPCFISLDSPTLEQEAVQLVCRVKKDWKIENVTTARCTDGITNVIVKCMLKQEGDVSPRVLLVRIYGRKTECLIDRERELSNFLLFYKYHLGPPLYATYTNGYVYGYLEGDACTPEELTLPVVYKGVAQRLAQMHKIPCPADCKPSVFDTIDRWVAEAPKFFEDEAKHKTLVDLNIPEALKQLEVVRSHMKDLPSVVVMSHNDLLCKNIIYCKETADVNFIDYEYATYNVRGFDIGNHFNEYAGIDNPNFSLYPSKDYQYTFLRHYLAEYLNVKENEVSNQELDTLYAETNKCALVSHFFWGIWAVIQSANSTIKFDFIGYANLRFAEFRKHFDEYLAL